MSNDSKIQRTMGLPTGNLSDEKIEELYEIRKLIMEQARKKVDPKGTGFDAQLVTDDDLFGLTDEVAFRDWLDWLEQVTSVILTASQRVGLAVISAGLAIAGAIMTGNDRSVGIGQFTLGVSAVFAVGFVVSALTSPKRGR